MDDVIDFRRGEKAAEMPIGELRARKRTYVGRDVAVERCPSYWFAAGYKIDPKDRRKLISPNMQTATKRGKGRAAIAG